MEREQARDGILYLLATSVTALIAAILTDSSETERTRGRRALTTFWDLPLRVRARRALTTLNFTSILSSSSRSSNCAPTRAQFQIMHRTNHP